MAVKAMGAAAGDLLWTLIKSAEPESSADIVLIGNTINTSGAPDFKVLFQGAAPFGMISSDVFL